MMLRLKQKIRKMNKTFFIFFSIPKDLFFGEPNIYHDLGVFYKNVGRLWRCVWLWRISGSYSQGMVPVVGIPRPLIPDQSSSRSGGCVVCGGCIVSTLWTIITTTATGDDGETKKKYGENDK